jgi:hypothetical protein
MSDLPEGTKPFDRRDIKKCALCRKGMAHGGDPYFYEIKIAQVVLDTRNIQRIHGLETFYGGGVHGAALADIMGDSSRVGVRMPETRALICAPCATGTESGMALMMIAENGSETGDDDRS